MWRDRLALWATLTRCFLPVHPMATRDVLTGSIRATGPASSGGSSRVRSTPLANPEPATGATHYGYVTSGGGPLAQDPKEAFKTEPDKNVYLAAGGHRYLFQGHEGGPQGYVTRIDLDEKDLAKCVSARETDPDLRRGTGGLPGAVLHRRSQGPGRDRATGEVLAAQGSRRTSLYRGCLGRVAWSPPSRGA